MDEHVEYDLCTALTFVAYDMGMDAHTSGIMRRDCPLRSPMAVESWERGWEHAARKAQQKRLARMLDRWETTPERFHP